MVEQKIRFSNRELELLKNTFAESEDGLKLIRKSMLQMNMLEKDDLRLKDLIKGDVIILLRKIFLPTLDGGAPMHQMVDLWLTLKIDDKESDLAFPHIQAREMLIRYMDERLMILEEKEVKEPLDIGVLADISGLDEKQVYTNLVCRNTIIMHIEQQLSQIQILAGMKNETADETLTRLKKDSNK